MRSAEWPGIHIILVCHQNRIMGGNLLLIAEAFMLWTQICFWSTNLCVYIYTYIHNLCWFNFSALAQGNAYKPTKESINYRAPGGDWTHDPQTEATLPAVRHDCFMPLKLCHTCLLLIPMLWHRQAIFQSKGEKLSSSAECRIRIWEFETPNRQQAECPLTNRLSYWRSSKNYNSTAHPHEWTVSPLDFNADRNLKSFPLKGNGLFLAYRSSTIVADDDLKTQVAMSSTAKVSTYHKISNIRHTNSPNVNVSRLDLQLSLPNPMKPGGKSRMKM